MADGDTGYGGLLNVQYTVRGYEAAGAVAIQLEDQEFPKKCGHMLGRRVVPIDDMVDKIKVAVASRDSADFLIIARTDARTTLGLDEALRRAEAYAKAGADILFVESPKASRRCARSAAAFDRPLVANMVEGGRTPVVRSKDLEESAIRSLFFPASASSPPVRRCARSTRTSKSTAQASAATCRSTSSRVQRTDGLRRGLRIRQDLRAKVRDARSACGRMRDAGPANCWIVAGTSQEPLPLGLGRRA